MAYGSVLTDVVQSSVTGTPTVFKDGAGTETGTLCRAWVNFNGTGTVAIRASFNVSSITDNGTGDYTINFTTALSDANYSAQVTAGNGVNDIFCSAPYTTAATVSAVRLLTLLGNRTPNDSSTVSVAIFR